ncbi:MAG: AAA family ATPase [Candidatus Obscuribacterales bacterium]|jgi:predicted ATPase
MTIEIEDAMAITDFKILGYRSIKEMWLKLQPINVIMGKNGTGKSNLYRAMYLFSCAANGSFAAAMAEEGGIESALWAGNWNITERPEINLSVRTDSFEYTLTCGLAGDVIRPGFFSTDPVITSEVVYRIYSGKPKKRILQRRMKSITARNSQGADVEYTLKVADNQSVLAVLRDPVTFPEMFAIREELLGWRFYHGFRKDIDSPLRSPQNCIMTPVLSHDGHDLASALATIAEVGDEEELSFSIQEAFPGSKLIIKKTSAGLRIALDQPGLERETESRELSDGTLQYLCLLGALLSITPPPVMILNEPENSLHPRLFAPLARLIMKASQNSQIWLTTHSQDLADAITELSGYSPYELTKVAGQSKLVGAGLGGYREAEDDD